MILYLAYFAADYIYTYVYGSRSQWPRGLRHRSAAARLLRSWVLNTTTVRSGCGRNSCLLQAAGAAKVVTRPGSQKLSYATDQVSGMSDI